MRLLSSKQWTHTFITFRVLISNTRILTQLLQLTIEHPGQKRISAGP